VIFLLFAPLAGFHIGLVEGLAVAGAIFLISFMLTGMGFVIAWKMESTAGFHAIMNLLLMPIDIFDLAAQPHACHSECHAGRS
jgi:ABC-2 type transport system permease protein